MEELRYCLCCHQEIQGRSDKKFCSTHCRNAWHNEVRQEREKVIRETNKVLKRNWDVLRKLNRTGKTKVGKIQLIARDFDFSKITEILVTREGKQYRYCYDQGYLDLGNSDYLLVHALKSND